MKRYTLPKSALLTALIPALLLAAPACSGEFEDDLYETDLSDEEIEISEQSIVGGSTTSIQQYPWQVSLQSRYGGHFCGGSIIDEEWILTAAHCIESERASGVRVVAGTSQLGSGGQVRGVSQIIAHPSYNGYRIEAGYDIALLRLSSPLTPSASVAVVPIVTGEDRAAGITSPGTLASVSGWGATREGGYGTSTLKAVSLPLVSTSQASQLYRLQLPDGVLAAGFVGEGGADACQGDSGGPLVVSGPRGPQLAGVVSWGYGCARANYPGLYTRVSSFESWLEGYIPGLGQSAQPVPDESPAQAPAPAPTPSPSVTPIKVASTAPIAIPDYSRTVRAVNFDQDFTVSTIDVSMTIDHPYPADVAVVIQSPSGRRVLLEQPGQNNSTSRDYVVRDFDGASISGQWTLEFYDVYRQDVGAIDTISLTFNP